MASERKGQARSAGGTRQAKASRDIAVSAARAAAISMGTEPPADGPADDLPAPLPALPDAMSMPVAEIALKAAADLAVTVAEAGEVASPMMDENMNETVDEAVSETAAELVAPAAQAAETVRTTATSTMERAMTTAEDFMAFGQGNMEALVKAGQIWATGLQDIGKTVADSAQAQIEQNVNAFRAMTGVKSLREVVDLQSTHARAALEKVVADSGKLTDASMKLAEQALAPITARLSIAAERFGRAA